VFPYSYIRKTDITEHINSPVLKVHRAPSLAVKEYNAWLGQTTIKGY